MKIQTVLLMGLLFVISGQVVAQEMSKDEKKKWVTMAKNFKKDPQALKMLVEERDQYRRQIQEESSQISSLQNSEAQANRRAAQLEQDLAQMNNELMNAQAMINQLSLENERLKATGTTTTNQGNNNTPVTGVVFRVQAGAFTKGRIPQNIQNLPDAMIEEDGNLQKVLVGNFQNVNQARARASELKQQGVEGAFVVAYKNGRRVSIEEATRN